MFNTLTVRTWDLMLLRLSGGCITNPDRQLLCHFSKTVLWTSSQSAEPRLNLYAVLKKDLPPQAHRFRRLLTGAQVHPPIGKVQPLAKLVSGAGFYANFFEAERFVEGAAFPILARHKGNGVAVAALAHAVQQGFVQPPANPLAHTVVGAVNG